MQKVNPFLVSHFFVIILKAMLERRIPKKRKVREMEKIISDVLVVADHELKPYIEMLNYAPENVTQKSLGRLLGFFEIKDENGDSAYIVNFLASVIKKEYFINTKRGPIESFESSLNKTNLALAEIAKHGNVNWLGKLDSALCAIEGNNIYFSASGNGKVLLMRNGTLSEISQGLAESEDTESDYLNPMKTFTNVSSGRLEDGDKIIITTDDIFHIFSLNEIKKGALQFSREKFVQFIKTALINELEIAGTIIIDVCKKIEKPKESFIPESKNEKAEEIELNAFSSKVFNEKDKRRNVSQYEKNLKIDTSENSEEGTEYTDKKTGHIYLKEDNHNIQIEAEIRHPLKEYMQEKISDFSYWMKNDGKKALVQIAKKTAQKMKNYWGLLKKISIETALKWKDGRLRKKGMREQLAKATFSTSISKPTEQNNQTNTYQKKIGVLKIKPSMEIFVNIQKLFSSFWKNKSRMRLIFPDFGKIKSIISKMSYSQKLYSAGIILAIIIIPLFFRNSGEDLPQTVPSDTSNQTPSFALAEEKNIQPENSLKKIFETTEVVKFEAEADGQLFLISGNTIVELLQEKELDSFTFPDPSSRIKSATFMPDLRLILILTDQEKIISFNTISKKFQENNFSAPEGAKIEDMETYLTYLYILDSNNNQIYRYPRADGGFGEKSAWLKEDIEIQDSSDMTIDENIFLSTGEQIEKFFRGKSEEFSIEQSKTPIENDLIFTSPENDFVYSIDKKNNRLVQFSKSGEIMRQFYDEKISSVESFIISDDDSKAYLAIPDGIYRFDIK
ncbi:MAG: Uncharacterized protein Athens071425_218 [Parcubacteria group bacterium Athens0714_25]|nr:MAG: Uncharacterized protein Athens071425_218 [Parcubacteria group bacterium Athens0714_25]